MKPTTTYSADTVTIHLALATDPHREPPIVVEVVGSVSIAEAVTPWNTLIDGPAGKSRGCVALPPTVTAEVDAVLGWEAARELVQVLGRAGIVYEV